MAVVSDRFTLDSTGYQAELLSAQDYYPFGLAMPGRSLTREGGDYRYGFNGKERDPEGLGGGGSTYDYGFRIYNPGIGKFLSVDPLTSSYPWYTPYQFAGNKPITFTDLDGLEELHYLYGLDGEKVVLKSVTMDLTKPTNIVHKIEYKGDVLEVRDPQHAAETLNWAFRTSQDRLRSYNGKIYGEKDVSEEDLELSQLNEDMKGLFHEMTWVLATDGLVRSMPSRLPKFNRTAKQPTSTPIVVEEALAGAKVADGAKHSVEAAKTADALGGVIVKVENSPYLIVQKGDRTFHISPDRVKEYVKNPLNPTSRWGDQVNFKKYGVPDGSEIIQGAGKGHKRTPTSNELKMYNEYFK